jgi:two-component system, cell cycle sensor histidine kinase and response regulator CckA
VVLSISDSGTGMPPEVVEHIFEPFFTTKEVGKGTGLGLATVYGIVHQHGGFIEVTSEPGRGSAFRVYLPASAEEEQGGSEPQVHTWNAPRGDETVLVAEDDDQVRSFASRILRDAGYTVLVAGDGEEALEVLARGGHEVDLLVLDSVMPKKGGRGVYDAFRATRPDVKVLFCTGYSSDPAASANPSGEHPPVLRKPFTPQALLRQVRTVLDGK